MIFKKIIISVFVLCLFGTTVCLSSLDERASYEHILAIPVARDAHGKFVIDGDELEKTSGYEGKFTEFVNHIKQAYPFMPVIVSLSVDKPHPELRSSMAPFQFVMYHTDNPRQKIEWIFRNGRKVPDPDTTAVGTNVMCVKLDTQEVILIKDHQKNFLSVPGGYVDRGETSLMAATRECKEEINLTVDPDKIKLAGLFQKIDKGERQEICLSVFLYVYPITADDICNIKLEEDEVAWFRLVKLSQINMQTGTVSTENGFLKADGTDGNEESAIKIHPNFLPILQGVLKGDEINSKMTKPTETSVTYVF